MRRSWRSNIARAQWNPFAFHSKPFRGNFQGACSCAQAHRAVFVFVFAVTRKYGCDFPPEGWGGIHVIHQSNDLNQNGFSAGRKLDLPYSKGKNNTHQMFLKTQKIWIPPSPMWHLWIPPVAISSDGDKQSAYQSSGAHTHPHPTSTELNHFLPTGTLDPWLVPTSYSLSALVFGSICAASKNNVKKYQWL